jgi:hypothetical protein
MPMLFFIALKAYQLIVLTNDTVPSIPPISIPYYHCLANKSPAKEVICLAAQILDKWMLGITKLFVIHLIISNQFWLRPQSYGMGLICILSRCRKYLNMQVDRCVKSQMP